MWRLGGERVYFQNAVAQAQVIQLAINCCGEEVLAYIVLEVLAAI